MLAHTMNDLPAISKPIADDDREGYVISALLHNPELRNLVFEYVPLENVFHYPTSRMLYRTIRTMHEEAQSIDEISLLDKARMLFPSDEYRIEKSIFKKYEKYKIDRENLIDHCKIISELYATRRAQASFKKLTMLGQLKYDEIPQAIIEHISNVEEISRLFSSKFSNTEEAMQEVFDSISSKSGIIETGLPYIDTFSGGITRKEMTIIAGRPGHMKTTLALNLAASLVKKGLKVAFISREMKKSELYKKLIVAESTSLSYDKIRKGIIQDEEQYIETTEMIKKQFQGNLFVFDKVFSYHESMHNIIKLPVQVDVIIDDYIQLADYDAKIDKRKEIEMIIKGYLSYANRKNVAIVILSQISREVEKRLDNNRPTSADLKESGFLEEAAENVIFTFYPYKIFYGRDGSPQHKIEIIGAKTRFGESKTVGIYVNGDRCKFYVKEEHAVAGI